jgi:hypothetical protein
MRSPCPSCERLPDCLLSPLSTIELQELTRHSAAIKVPARATVYSVEDPQHQEYNPAHLGLAQTDTYGKRDVYNKYTNVFWSITRYSTGTCGVITKAPIFIPQGSKDVPLPCDSHPFFNANPNSFDVSSPPSTITFTGDAMLDATYGMPTIDFYDEAGNWVGSTSASSVANDGTSLTLSTPSFLTQQYSGSYIAVISNVNEDYSVTAVVASAVDLYGNDPPPPPECDCGMTCEEYDQTVANCEGAGGTWLSWGCVCQGP